MLAAELSIVMIYIPKENCLVLTDITNYIAAIHTHQQDTYKLQLRDLGRHNHIKVCVSHRFLYPNSNQICMLMGVH